jgi:hypothetical protein
MANVPLSDDQRRALDSLSHAAAVKRVYLAGGTAIALWLRHRQSLDLNFFTRGLDARLPDVRDEFIAALDGSQVISETDAAVSIKYLGTALDIVRYPYPLLQPITLREGIPVAGLLDLATMKLAAVARRGIRRDFWDLEVLVSEGRLALDTALDAYVGKFGVHHSDRYHVIRALTYFDDAEAEPIFPRGLSVEGWERIKAFFRQQAPRLLRGS